jgi:hypothetical protein
MFLIFYGFLAILCVQVVHGVFCVFVEPAAKEMSLVVVARPVFLKIRW